MNEQTPKFETGTPADFVVIGAGAAGGVMAKELSTAGFQVVVLEQGPYLKEKDFDHDEIKNLWQGALINDWKKQPNSFRKTPKDKAKVQPAILYGRMVGGGTTHFTANYWRFHEIDFIERSKLGAISGTGFDDWPITFVSYTRTANCWKRSHGALSSVPETTSTRTSWRAKWSISFML